jgi:hypothetical protein
MTTLASTLQPGRGSTLVASTLTVTRRALLRYVRTPQLIVMAVVQMSLFFLIYRYMFGGAIRSVGVPYVDYLVPGFVATGVLFNGIGAAVPRPRTSSRDSWIGCARCPCRARAFCSPA